MSEALPLARARQCIESGIAKARELGFEVAVAVVDEAGHLVACDRMDGALWVTPEIARAKANAAVAFHASTLDLEQRFEKRALFAGGVMRLGDYEFIFGKGGMPIVDGGRIVGAVGVSGAVPADNDHTIADVAANMGGLDGPPTPSDRRGGTDPVPPTPPGLARAPGNPGNPGRGSSSH